MISLCPYDTDFGTGWCKKMECVFSVFIELFYVLTQSQVVTFEIIHTHLG